jgi:hypothetical protein
MPASRLPEHRRAPRPARAPHPSAGRLLETDEVIVIGSQAILASVATGLPVEATRSIEADILPFDDPDEAKADLIDGLLGEASMFQETHGICAQGVGQHTARLPDGWQERLVPLSNENTGGVTGWCLEPHDLCASKLLAGRPKDAEFCRALLHTAIVEPATLAERLALTDATPSEIELGIIERTSREPERSPRPSRADDPDIRLGI